MKLFLTTLILCLMFFGIYAMKSPEIFKPEKQELEKCDSVFRDAYCPLGSSCINVVVDPYVVGICYTDEEIEGGKHLNGEKRIDYLLANDNAIVIRN